MARLDRYRIGIPRELSEILTQPWLSEGSLTVDTCAQMAELKAHNSPINAITTNSTHIFTASK